MVFSDELAVSTVVQLLTKLRRIVESRVGAFPHLFHLLTRLL